MTAPDYADLRSADGPCDECGHHYPPWWIDHGVWNLTLGGPEVKGDPGGMLCPLCFMRKAAPIRGAWHLTNPALTAEREALIRERDEARAKGEAVAWDIENPRHQRPGMQRRRQWADRLHRALADGGTP